MLCYLTQRWFTNDPCLREFIRAILRKTPMIALLEPFRGDTYGGHTEAEAREIIASPEWWARWQRFDERGEVAKWAIEWGQPGLRLPTAQEAVDALFASEPITFSRLSDFQDVTMRLIGERLTQGFAHLYGEKYEQIGYMENDRPVAYVTYARAGVEGASYKAGLPSLVAWQSVWEPAASGIDAAAQADSGADSESDDDLAFEEGFE
jgi:hypothetical protein